MYGSYTEVSGGVSSDSYMALTGGVPEEIDLTKLHMDPGQLHTRVRNALYSNAAVTCGTSVSSASSGKSIIRYCANCFCSSFPIVYLSYFEVLNSSLIFLLTVYMLIVYAFYIKLPTLDLF